MTIGLIIPEFRQEPGGTSSKTRVPNRSGVDRTPRFSHLVRALQARKKQAEAIEGRMRARRSLERQR